MPTPIASLALFATVVLLALGSACAPQSQIRRSAFIPGASLPARVGAELHEGEVRLAGHVNAGRADAAPLSSLNWTEVGDPGVFIPDFQLGASGWFGLGGGLEIGGQLQFASLSWARRNTVGVLDFPSQHQESLLLGGVGLRYNVPIDHPALRLGLIGEVNYVSIPQAVFVLEQDAYRFERIDDEGFLLPNVALQLGWEERLGHRITFAPHLLLGAQRSVTNVGFDDDLSRLDDSTLEGFIAGYVGVGVDFRIHALAVGASLYFPFDGVDRIEFGPSFAVTLGGVIGGEPAAAPHEHGPAPRAPDDAGDPYYDDGY